MTKAQLYCFVEKIRQLFEISSQCYPLSIFDICEATDNIQIQQIPFKTKGLRGMVCIANKSDENHVILLNENKTEAENNYHGTHEFMHIFTADDNAGKIIRCFDIVKPNQNAYTEWLANEGAAELLVPYRIFLPLVRENYESMLQDSGTYKFCQEYADHFNVSPVVLEHRLRSLKYEIYQYINGVNIDNIGIISKHEQDLRNIQVKSLIEMEDERFLSRFNNRIAAV